MKNKVHILVLWSTPSGYMDACMRALLATGKAEVFFISQTPVASVAPLDLDRLDGSYQSANFKKPTDYNKLLDAIDGFKPDIVLAGGSWREPAYRKLLAKLKGNAIRVFCSDAQWQGSLRQWLSVLSMRIVRKKLYDRAFVAGERQLNYAMRLGFSSDQIQTGLYACDHGAFSSASAQSTVDRTKTPSFLFVGRLVDIKGIKELLDGYELYRRQNNNPWPLVICGTGPLEGMVRHSPDIHYKGFVQPEELPQIMASHTTLIVPSHVEPWALVIHEAASAGMSIICSKACGAGDAFVQNGVNGQLLTDVSSISIAAALEKVSRLDNKALDTMNSKSSELAATMTPDTWAEKVLAFSKSD